MNNKYLVNLLNALSHKQLFLVGWLAVSSFFIFLMVLSYRKSVQRNFRSTEKSKSFTPVEPKRLESGKKQIR